METKHQPRPNYITLAIIVVGSCVLWFAAWPWVLVFTKGNVRATSTYSDYYLQRVMPANEMGAFLNANIDDYTLLEWKVLPDGRVTVLMRKR